LTLEKCFIAGSKDTSSSPTSGTARINFNPLVISFFVLFHFFSSADLIFLTSSLSFTIEK
jgi:hypothetical protein